ncbi:Cubilin [Folsomia candida]|uniref:Cubilin n=1 Tax=Folsomia candida TaxID=158441 RepID=A0A226DFF3_FOLCA|nr:Cubilin [Folsomia candida]
MCKGGCGGVIEAQSGRIIGTSSAGLVDNVECMWTISANHRQRVKLTLLNQKLLSYSSGYMSLCKVHEVQVNYGQSFDTPALSVTSITSDKTYLFRGPLLFLTCQCNLNPRNQFVEFEGLGPRVFSRVSFQHTNVQNLTGSYDVATELTNGASQLSDKTGAFITITIPGLDNNSSSPMKNIILQNLSPKFCKSSSLSMHFDLFNPDAMMSIDCCQVDCLNHKFLVRNDYCLVLIGVNISAGFEQTTSSSSSYARLAWDIQEHTLKPKYGEVCGGVISGRSEGGISESYSSYQPNSRCVWIIHPFPRTEIVVTLTQLQIEEGRENLFAVGIDDDGGLVTTPLTEENVLYELSGRVILIVFYSDTSLQLYGFSLTWKAKGPVNLSMFTNDDKIHRYTERNGTSAWNLTMPPTWPGLHVGIINHFESYQPYACNLRLDYQLTGSTTFLLFESTNATFNNLINVTRTSTSVGAANPSNFTSRDSVFLLVAKLHEPQSSVRLNFNWDQGEAVAPTSYSTCGGRIEPAQQARIGYKTGQPVGANIRCVWLIECRYANVTFDLIKNGLTRHGIISIDTIDPGTGKIDLNSTTRISTESPRVVVRGPLILLKFASSPSQYSSETGFELEYAGSGSSIQDGRTYEMRHWSTASSTVEYPISDGVPSSTDLLIIGQNPDVTSTLSISDKLTLQFMSHAMKSSTVGQGYNFSLYSFSSWDSNNTFAPAVDCTVVTGLLEEECDFSQAYASADFHSKSETFDMKFNNSGFLAIVKPLQRMESTASREFELTWNTGGCGGLISLPNGKIDYKVYQYYSSNENCIWLIDGTKFGATSILFNLEVSGVLDRDAIYVYPVSLSLGTIGVSTRLRHEASSYSYLPVKRNITVQSGIALVSFRSTSSSSIYSSTLGRGFRLSYSLRRIRSTTRESPGKTFVLFPNLANNEMQLPMSKRITSLNHNDTIIMFFNSPQATSSSSSSSSSTTSTTTLNITIEDLDLFVNSKNCVSDSLYFYYYSFSSFYLKESFRSFKNPEASCNDTTEAVDLVTGGDEDEEYQVQESIYEDIMSPSTVKKPTVKNTCNAQCYETNVLSTLTPTRRRFIIAMPTLVIYKSNSNHTEGKKVRFTWTTTLS